MGVLGTCVVAAVGVLALASCGAGESVASSPDAAASTVGSPGTPSAPGTPASPPTESAPATPSTSAGAARSPKELFDTLDRAIARESSVRQEMGNLNPPPPVILHQEYGAGRDALSLSLGLGSGAKPMRIYRIDGLVYAEGQDPRPASELEPDDTALIAVLLRSDVRQDFRRMARLAGDFEYVGAEDVLGVETHHYRMTLTLAPGANPATVPTQLEGPKPADLWVGEGGLPVRLEVKYSEPLQGVPGTGVSRTDFSAWSEPLRLDPESLDWG